MTGSNVLFIMSDEHSRRVLGAYGNTVVKTPHLDRMAAEGTLFESAYCNCPICVPSRASFATGRYVHEIGFWDNGIPYHGEPASFGHRLADCGQRCDSIGKLHYRAAEDPNGFDNEILPLHVLNGTGDLKGMLRSPPPKRPGCANLAKTAGVGDSGYIRYDRDIRDAACAWIEGAAASPPDKPWVLFVSFVCPHFPLIAPPEFFNLYDPAKLPMPQLRGDGEFPDHPVLKALREVQNYEDHFRDEAHVRLAMQAYCGMVSYLDDNIGRILASLDKAGLGGDTTVLYSSDHGDNLGARTFWGKSNMYDESAGVPLIVKGPGVAAGRRVKTPVSLVDAYPTILSLAGVTPPADDADKPGTSLLDIADGAEADRTILSEYHAVGSTTGMFMIRWRQYKYIHFEGHRPQLFDLDADPLETRDLALAPGNEALLAEGDKRLRAICDPTEVNKRAFADQAEMIARHGGVEKVMAGTTFPYTPAPGEKAVLA